jgi:hypothetical protein
LTAQAPLKIWALKVTGRTQRCSKQFGADLPDQWRLYTVHSPSGRVTQLIFFERLSFLGRMIPDGATCLVLDQYPSHIAAMSKAHAAILGTRVIKTPKGATSARQPLDRRIYGVMKSKARARWERLFALDYISIAAKEVAAELALECWYELAEHLITSACDFEDT